jgi:hypothetical protein
MSGRHEQLGMVLIRAADGERQKALNRWSVRGKGRGRRQGGHAPTSPLNHVYTAMNWT